MGWLRGYPRADRAASPIPWTSVSGGLEVSELEVDRSQLQRAVQQLTGLPLKFPRALPALVGDVARWKAGFEAKLTLLKQAIHHGRPFPCSAELLDPAALLRRGCRLRAPERAELLRNLRTPMLPLLRALIWLHWQDGPRLLAAVRFVTLHRQALEAVLTHASDGLQLCLCLCEQAAIDAGCLEPLLALWARPLCWQVVWAAPEPQPKWLAELSKRLRARQLPAGPVPARPVPELGSQLLDACRAFFELKPATRTRAFCLHGAVLPGPELNAAERWWERFEHVVQETARLHVIRPAADKRWDALRVEVASLRQPTQEPPACLWRLCRKLAKSAGNKLFSKMLGLLSRAGEAGELRRGLVQDWGWEFCGGQVEAGRCLQTCATLAELLPLWVPSGLQPAERRRAVRRALYFAQQLSSLFVGGGLPARSLADTRRVLLAIAQQIPAAELPQVWRGYRGLSCLSCLARELEPAAIVELVRVFPAESAFFACRQGWLRGLVRLFVPGARPIEAVQLLHRSADQWGELGWRDSPGDALRELAGDKAAAPLLRALMAQGVSRPLRRLLLLAGMVRDAHLPGRFPRPPRAEPAVLDPARTAACPPTLLPSLRILAGVASKRAERLARRLFPSSRELQQQITAIEARIDQLEEPSRTHLRLRLANLRTRQAEGSRFGPSQLRKAAQRLETARCAEQLAIWLRDAEAWTRAQLQARLGAPLPSDLTRDSSSVHVLGCLFQLEPHFCMLGLRLLRTRQGPRPWDLRTAPANAAFLERMQARGLKTSPWLDGWGRRAVERNGRKLWLELEDDPLEVMRMGAPFKTCLAPGSFNFFASVANAADINKRVLYARATDGVVVGRCLLALTTDGGIVTYHPYAHDRALDFPELVKQQVIQLAHEMGATAVPDGTVELLLARDWYDDGGVDLLERFAFLRADSDFRKSLGQMPSARLLPRLEKELHEKPLSALSLHRVLKLPEFEKRPELCRTLLPLCQRAALPERARVRAAELARLSGKKKIAGVLLQAADCEKLDSDGQAALARELCLSGAPHRALAVLRRTRSRGVRSWEDEPLLRLEVAAQAMAGLHRRQRAIALFEAALAKTDGHKSARARLQASLKALRAELGG